MHDQAMQLSLSKSRIKLPFMLPYESTRGRACFEGGGLHGGKSRDEGASHGLHDAVRVEGAAKQLRVARQDARHLQSPQGRQRFTDHDMRGL